MARVEAICVSVRKGEKKTPQPSARFVAGHGIEGDAHAGAWHRQVSLLAAEDIERMRARGLPDVRPGDFAANVVVSGINLSALSLGSRLRLGAHTELNVTQIGKVCHHRCAIYARSVARPQRFSHRCRRCDPFRALTRDPRDRQCRSGRSRGS